MTTLEHALRYRAGGLSPIAIRADGTKAPPDKWKDFQSRIATEGELYNSMNHGRKVGIGIACGVVSGGLEVIDFDCFELFEPFRVIVNERAPGLLDRLTMHHTPRPGMHVIYRCVTVDGNQALAEHLVFNEARGKHEPKALIETRGQGGYIIAPGSPPETHPDNKLYEHVSGPAIENAPQITPEERSILFDAARTFNEYVAEPDDLACNREAAGDWDHDDRDGLSPGDDFNQRATWEEILEPAGWTKVHVTAGLTHWRRPGKDCGTSATTGCVSRAGSSLMNVFSTSTAFEVPAGKTCGNFNKFAAYAVLNHNGDFKSAAKALAALGYGEQRKLDPSEIDVDRAATAIAPINRICNAVRVKDGNSTETFPLTIQEITDRANKLTDGWPRRVGSALFVHDQDHGLAWLESTGALFGYYQTRTGMVTWHKSTGCVGREDFFQEQRRTAHRYAAIERYPHEPRFPAHYYACKGYEPGDGKTLDELLSRFSPETTIDCDLLKAAIVTPFWGGPCGMRPLFVVTADGGRGVGKSTAVALIARIAGGSIPISANEDSTKLRERLLSSEALVKRVPVVDNLKSLKFSWADMESMVTAKEIAGRKMYVGEASRPNNLTWFVTLNGASLSTDVAQRAVIIKLAKPVHDGNWELDTANFIDENHDRLLSDIIGFLRSERTEDLKRHTRWGAWERDVLCRLPEPFETQKIICERQGAADVEQEESELLEEFFSGQLVTLGYSPAEDRVHIPTAVAARWFNWATSTQHTVTGASRSLTQMVTEAKCRRLSVNPSRTHGRGFLWIGSQSDMGTHTWTDLNERLAERARRERQ